ncbi:MAG: response regulator transcription factor [Angelakisella sp.]|jgi:two-component system response regulator ResD|nr:response regulator transcription factor [Angelakisella sp.]MCI9528414.1 response regulator transcription factor [Angelakisella sp.]
MYHILVVDDEENIRQLVRKYANFEGYKVTEAADGMEALEICRQCSFDLIIMDVMMPELDGFSALRRIRQQDRRTPVLMLSARGEEYDRIHGFELGVDDYVVKPFSPKELMLRVSAILRRAGSHEDLRELYTVEGITADFTGRRVLVDGREADMSPKEYDLFFYLVKNRGIALTRDKLLNDVWGYDFYGDERTLDTHIKLLRKTLGPYSGHIVTLRGVGYRFEG